MEGRAWRGIARTYPRAARHVEGVAHAHKGRGGAGCAGLGRAEQGGLGKGALSWGARVEETGLARRRSWGVAMSCDVAAESTTATRVGRRAP